MGRVSGRNHGWIDRFVAEDGTSSNNIQLSSKVAAGVGISGCLLPFFLNSIDGPDDCDCGDRGALLRRPR